MKLPKRLLAAAGALAFGAASVAGAGIAQAAPVDVTFNITGGALSIGGESLEFPAGSTFVGTWDDETGALTGSLTVPAFSIDVDDPFPLTIGIQISQVGAATGNVDPVSGAATLTVTLNVALSNALLPAGCGIQGIVLNLSSNPPGSPLNFDTGQMGLAASGFEVPGASGCGTIGEINVDDAVSGALGLPTEDTSTILVLQQLAEGEEPPPVTDPTQPTVPPQLPPTGSSTGTVTAIIAALTLAAGAALVLSGRRRITA